MVFDHWQGSHIKDPYSAFTQVLMDEDKLVRAVFLDARLCGDVCHPIRAGDANKDCRIDFEDLLMTAMEWMDCSKPKCD